MHIGNLVFTRLMDFLPWHTFRRLVAKYHGDFNERTFSCLDQFLSMAFAQLTYRESLRGIEACLRAQPTKLYHMGLRGTVSRSALADANGSRDWRIYAEFAHALIRTARRLYAQEPLAVDLAETVYVLDATTIDLCLSLFPWAKFRRTKAAVKLHTLLDLRGAIPSFIHICDGKLHDVKVLDVFDRFEDDRGAALAELSFFHAEKSGQPEYYLAAAAYAYAFLLPEGVVPAIRPIDPRGRLAVDLYNWGVTRGLSSPDGEEVVLEGGTRALPFGEMALTVEASRFLWGAYRLKRFIPVGEFVVRGLRNRYRQAGAGAPLAAEVEPADLGPGAEPARRRIPPRMKVPVTAFIRIAEPLRGIVEGKIQGRIEVYAVDQAKTVRVGDREVPLELEPTAALAYQLERAPVWDFEIAGFRFGEPG